MRKVWQDERLSEQSYELAWIAFLFGKNKLDSMEKRYTNEEYGNMLYRLYPPHKDKIGYKSRLLDLGENLSEVVRAYKKDEILSESEHMKLIKKVMQLSVDFLRFHMYAEGQLLKQEVGENTYLTLKVRDANERTEFMLETIGETSQIESFDEELYRKLIKEIIVNKDSTATVVFYNGSRLTTEYGKKECHSLQPERSRK